MMGSILRKLFRGVVSAIAGAFSQTVVCALFVKYGTVSNHRRLFDALFDVEQMVADWTGDPADNERIAELRAHFNVPDEEPPDAQAPPSDGAPDSGTVSGGSD
jgi:hypothetical protein